MDRKYDSLAEVNKICEKANATIHLPQDNIELSYNQQFERAASAYLTNNLHSYVDYFRDKFISDYTEGFDLSDPWILALHLRMLMAKLDSEWITNLVDDNDIILLDKPVPGCRVSKHRLMSERVYR